ncbi:MAG: GMC family oxidoreductase [Desulfatibacillum sp.]|nr:GMC family oxidoreductase [Desulfatibacillum sp.]
MSNASKSYDAIVVGSGPGGATVAKELANKGKKVLMMDWGGDEPIKGTYLQAAEMGGVPGKSMLFTYKGLSMVRAITAGGSSVLYYGTAFEPPLDMLKAYGVDIEREVREVKEELPIAPLQDRLIGPMAKRIMESARELGYDWNPLNKYVYQDKCRVDCDKCNLGCPYGAKWSARMFVDEFKQNRDSRFIARAKARRVLVEGNTAVGVEFVAGGTLQKAYAPVVILGAGGIGTPVILRESKIYGAGYDYFFDPLICVMGTIPEDLGGREFPMATGMHMPEEGYVMTDMTVPKGAYQAFAAQVGRVHKVFSHSRTLQIMIKAKDTLGGKLTDSGGVRKHLIPEDNAKLMKGYERATGILKNAGAKDIFKSWYIAAHPGGTAKIGDIVDSNLQTQYDNLYVCDCSVIPEAWGLPPSLTLVALGKRLARHIIAEPKTEEQDSQAQAA